MMFLVSLQGSNNMEREAHSHSPAAKMTSAPASRTRGYQPPDRSYLLDVRDPFPEFRRRVDAYEFMVFLL